MTMTTMKRTGGVLLGTALAVSLLLYPALAQGQEAPAPAARAPQSAAVLRLTATLKPNPPRVGDNALDLFVTDAAGKPVTGLTLTTRVEMTSMDMGTAKPAFKEAGGGHYRATLRFSMAGPWRLGLRGRTPDGGTFAGALDFAVAGKGAWKPPPLTLTVVPPPSRGEKPPAVAPPVSPVPAPPVAAPATAAPPPEPAPVAEPPTHEEAHAPPAPDAKPTAGMAHMAMSASHLPQLKEKRVTTVTGKEDWKVRTGFGKNYSMVAMMLGMMVEGTGLNKMKMDVMKMDFGAANFTEDQEDGLETAPVAAQAEVKEAAPAAGTTGASSALKVTAKVEGSPKVGGNKVVITVLDGTGKPVVGAKVTVAVAMTSMDMGTARPPVKEAGKGVYTVTANFSMAGPWRLALKVTPPGGKPQAVSVDITVK